MEKEAAKLEAMESLLPTKILRKSSVASKAARPKSYEFVEHFESSCRSSDVYSISTKFCPSAIQHPETVDDWDELIGQPVCISGIKQGILRYYGRTKFADGLWCGVELEESVGKNDGMVNGVRYFYCKPNHGIFAPVTKVSLLPLSEFKRHSITGDQNFYRKQEKHLHYAACSDFSFLKQSSSDPTFQRENGGRICHGCPDKTIYLGDKRRFTEQRDLSSLLDNGNECSRSKFYVSLEKMEKTLPFALSNSSTLPMETHSLEKHNRYVRQSQNGNAYGLDQERLEYMNFPRKVMSEYALNAHRNKATLSQSHSCPHSTLALKSMEVNTSSILTAKSNSGDVLSQYKGCASEFKLEKEQKHSSRPFHPSSEFLDLQDDNDDDQISLDYDESLGILTPSEMKDFTLCADLPTSYSDTRALDFPSSESFDDVNDLPEDEEVQDASVQYIASGSSNFVQTDISSAQAKHVLHDLQQNYNPKLTSTDKFLSSISVGKVKEVHIGSTYTSYVRQHCTAADDQEAAPASISVDLESNKGSLTSDASNAMEKVLNLTAPSSESTDETLACATSPPLLVKSEANAASVDTTPVSQSSEELQCKEQLRDDLKLVKYSDTDSSRDSLFQGQEHGISKEKLTVSWEDCIVEDTDDIFSKTERPESVYTVGSNDTGYQEDGDFEQDAGMTTSMESSEDCKRFSTVSRDSCVPVEDLDGDKVAESTSTSGYSTGLSDSCCNDRRDENGRMLMEDSFQDVADSCNSDDAQESAHFQEQNCMPSEELDGFFDMDSFKDSESASDFHITESNTVLGLDSTCETLCDTVTEDETVRQINGNGFASRVNEAPNSDVKDEVDVGVVPGNQVVEKVICNDSQKSAESSAKTTPEKKPDDFQQSGYNKNYCKDKSFDKKKNNDVKSPKRNVMSKIKAVIGGTSKSAKTKNENTDQNIVKKPVVPKRSRWEAVTSKIAASLAEEKTKPKLKKEVKSRVDTNLSSSKSPKLDLSSASDNKNDFSLDSSTSSKSRKNDRQSQRNAARSREGKQSMEVTGIEHGPRSPRPSKTCLSSRSPSPVAASESSTSVSLTSHHSRSKIAVWKGSNSTVASSIPPVPLKTFPASGVMRSSNQNNNRLQNKDVARGVNAGKLRPLNSNTVSCPFSPRSSRSDAASKRPCTRLKNTKEQGNATRPLVAPRPVRPPMWLSKAELSQEIQHLSTLCESRTKELNRLRMETRKVTTGFDALAVVVRYMTVDLKAFENPSLIADLKEIQDKVNQGKEELGYYQEEIEKLNTIHANEMKVLSETMQSEHQEKVQEIISKHNIEVNHLNEQHEKEIKTLSSALQASCDEEKKQNAKMLNDLQQELRNQREEMEIFHQHELNDLEEQHLEKQNALMADIEKLQKQYEESKQLSQNMEDALQKDTDTRLQWLTSKRLDLQNEVDSLKAVLEIKNNELHSLRKENLEMQKELEELPLAREKIKMLQARAEDLQALMTEKVRIERQLSTEHQAMKETYEREAKVTKRLSMENEELVWRLKQITESSLMTIPMTDECETETDCLSDLSSSCPPAFSEEVPSSPVKSPRPASAASASRPVFFTYMNQDELNARSPQSPRTHYKRIQSGSAPLKAASPAKQYKSPSRPSPRKSRGSTDLSPHCGGETPRKIAKCMNRTSQEVSSRSQRTTRPEKEQSLGENTGVLDLNALVLPESMVSSGSSENSVFEPCLLEEHSEQICESLKMLEEQRTSDFIVDVSSLSCNSKGEWQMLSERMDCKVASVDQDISEAIDPKTYYHMTFPVRESVQEIEVYEGNKEVKSDREVSSQGDESSVPRV